MLMVIRVSRREGSASCPYCHDEVVEGPACPACGVRYHDECAATFGRCAILGCRVPLEVAAPEATPLPRLVAMAPRLFALRPGAAAPLEDDDAHIVALLPGSPESADAAAAVGDLLGHSPYDGRMRLLCAAPEPLVRVRTGADAEAVVSRLAGYRVKALAIPAADLLRPLVRVDAVDVEDGDPPRIIDPIAGPSPLPTPRLVVTATLLEVHQREEVKNLWEGRKLKKNRVTSRKVSERFTEPAALVFGEHERDPVLLRRDGTKLRGSADPTAIGRFSRILDACTRGAAVVRLENATTAALLSRRRPLSAAPVEENLPAVLLAARLLHASWLAGA